MPTFFASEGASLWQVGSALSVLELAGAAGALLSGTISDRWGRRRVLTFIIATAPPLTLLFLTMRGWAIAPMLIVLGFVVLSTNPVLMALVQEHGHSHPATANGLCMASGFTIRALLLIVVGAMADRWGLHAAFQWSALLGFLALPFVLLLPKQPLER